MRESGVFACGRRFGLDRGDLDDLASIDVVGCGGTVLRHDLDELLAFRRRQFVFAQLHPGLSEWGSRLVDEKHLHSREVVGGAWNERNLSKHRWWTPCRVTRRCLSQHGFGSGGIRTTDCLW